MAVKIVAEIPSSMVLGEVTSKYRGRDSKFHCSEVYSCRRSRQLEWRPGKGKWDSDNENPTITRSRSSTKRHSK
eukprot:scaffold26835_cov85-Skeletonema_dohrnii-CCMP3373.AAC.1